MTKRKQLSRHLYNLPLYTSFSQKELNASASAYAYTAYAYTAYAYTAYAYTAYAYTAYAFKPYLSQEYIYLIFNLGKEIREGDL